MSSKLALVRALSVLAVSVGLARILTNDPGAGTGFAPIASRNALVRATGDILVPVELMNFSVQ